MKKDLTNKDVYEKFIKQNPILRQKITDYRPYGPCELVIYLDNGVGAITRYDVDRDRFQIIHIWTSEIGRKENYGIMRKL